VEILSAWIYTNGAWEIVPGYYSAFGAWHEFMHDLLFNNGTMYAPWSEGTGTSGTKTVENTGTALRLFLSSTAGSAVSYVTNNPMVIVNKRWLCMDILFYNQATTLGRRAQFGVYTARTIRDTSGNTQNSTAVYTVNSTGINRLDISSISGGGFYVGFSLSAYSSTGVMTNEVLVRRVWIE